MVKRCIATRCSNTQSDGVSLFHFPRDPLLRLQWTRQVQRTRDGWKGPNDYSVVCSEHFTSDCFEEDSTIVAKFGIEKKANVVPTVFLHANSSSTQSSSVRDTNTEGQCSSCKRAGEEVSIPVEKKNGI